MKAFKYSAEKSLYVIINYVLYVRCGYICGHVCVYIYNIYIYIYIYVDIYI